MAEAATLKRKDQITQVATDMFRERGYAATSMRDLANTIGIEPASLYSHIKSKEEILQKVCFDIAAEFFRSIEQIDNSTTAADVRFKQAVEAHIRVIRDNASAFAVFLNEWRHLSGTHLVKFKHLRRRYEDIFRGIIRDGIREGKFENIDEKLVVLTTFSSLNWTHVWFSPSGSATPKEIGEHLGYLILNGIKKSSDH